jgi:hypothetical protein
VPLPMVALAAKVTTPAEANCPARAGLGQSPSAIRNSKGILLQFFNVDISILSTISTYKTTVLQEDFVPLVTNLPRSNPCVLCVLRC